MERRRVEKQKSVLGMSISARGPDGHSCATIFFFFFSGWKMLSISIQGGKRLVRKPFPD